MEIGGDNLVDINRFLSKRDSIIEALPQFNQYIVHLDSQLEL